MKASFQKAMKFCQNVFGISHLTRKRYSSGEFCPGGSCPDTAYSSKLVIKLENVKLVKFSNVLR